MPLFCRAVCGYAAGQPLRPGIIYGVKPSRRVATDLADPALRPSVVFVWAAVAIAVTVGLTAFLVYLSDGADPRRLAGLLDVVRIGLSVGVGTGGLFALWLATRRQRSAEQTLVLQREASQTTVVDSTERRITEQYNKAIEQLGHEKAAVRLGAIYSLERLAQEHVGHRQTVVDVFCSYLRLPYEPPADRGMQTKSTAGLSPEAIETYAELEVRHTVQSMLWEHLGDPEKRKTSGERQWPDLELDLSRTTLVDPILRQLTVRRLTCEDMVVYGIADFRDLRVAEPAGIHGRFYGEAIFANSVFAEGVGLMSCVFEDDVDLSDITSPHLFMTDCCFRGEVVVSGRLPNVGVFKCKFDHDLALRGRMRGVFVIENQFEGDLVTEGLEVTAGSVIGCSFRTPPDRHTNIVLIDDMESASFYRGIAAHFGIDDGLSRDAATQPARRTGAD
jgi:hypothetical protein